MINFLLLLTLSSTQLFAGPREDVEILLNRFQHETELNHRLDQISKNFLGLPYGKNGPLGEGMNGRYDQDPLYRFDTFDCTTYVETMMALALSRDVNEFETFLDEIRYQDGDVHYLKRNHFTDLQWIPFNVQNGYMKEINHLVAPPSEIKIAEALINFPAWLRSHKIEQIIVPEASQEERLSILQELHGEAMNFQTQMARVTYIPISTLVARPALLNKIPTGTVVNFVRPNWDLTTTTGTHQNISHQGFLFYVGKVIYLRHASTAGKVEELPFINYLKRFQNHSTMKGIHLMQVNP
jgi:hypothetical protein